MQTTLLDLVLMDKKLITNSLELWLRQAIIITITATIPTRDHQTTTPTNDHKIQPIRDQIIKINDHNSNSKQCLHNSNMFSIITTITIMINTSSNHIKLLQLPAISNGNHKLLLVTGRLVNKLAMQMEIIKQTDTKQLILTKLQHTV